MQAELLTYWGSDLVVVNNARVSFDRESSWASDLDDKYYLFPGDQRLIQYLARGCTKDDWDQLVCEAGAYRDNDELAAILKHVKRMPEHWAPFANGVGMRFRITAPFPIMRQVFKHKVGSVESEVSRRYVDTPPDYFQPRWRSAADNVKQGSGGPLDPYDAFEAEGIYHHAIATCDEAYSELLRAGVCPEQARFVLPQATYTEAIVSNSLYGWARFFIQRSDRSHAQQEIADLADMIGKEASTRFPVSWAALTE
jgi:thymidylate synthase (FAD)